MLSAKDAIAMFPKESMNFFKKDRAKFLLYFSFESFGE